MSNNVVQIEFWVEEGNSEGGHSYPKFILEKGDCEFASFIECIRKKEISPTKEEILDLRTLELHKLGIAHDDLKP
jgi:hypothetical protein